MGLLYINSKEISANNKEIYRDKVGADIAPVVIIMLPTGA